MMDVKRVLAKLLGVTETRTLLWENPSPNNSFAAQDVTSGMSGAYNKYDYIEIEYKSINTENTDYGAKLFERTPCHAGTVASIIAYNNAWYNRHRARWWNADATGIHFDTAFYHNLENTSSHGTNDNVLIPYKIYGIKIGGGYFLDLFSAIERWWRHGRCQGIACKNIGEHAPAAEGRSLQVGLLQLLFRWSKANKWCKSLKFDKPISKAIRIHFPLLDPDYFRWMGRCNLCRESGVRNNEYLDGIAKGLNVKRVSTRYSTLYKERPGIALFQIGGGGVNVRCQEAALQTARVSKRPNAGHGFGYDLDFVNGSRIVLKGLQLPIGVQAIVGVGVLGWRCSVNVRKCHIDFIRDRLGTGWRCLQRTYSALIGQEVASISVRGCFSW